MESKHLRFWGSVILASGVFVLFGIIIPNNLWFLISIPIMVMVAGIALIIAAIVDHDMIENKTDTKGETHILTMIKSIMNPKQESSSLNTKIKTDDGPLSHGSKEYHRWKEGK